MIVDRLLDIVRLIPSKPGIDLFVACLSHLSCVTEPEVYILMLLLYIAGLATLLLLCPCLHLDVRFGIHLLVHVDLPLVAECYCLCRISFRSGPFNYYSELLAVLSFGLLCISKTRYVR